jgi:hypothetical protein
MRPDIAQAIHDAAVSDRAEYLDNVSSMILCDAFLSIIDWGTARESSIHGFPGWLRSVEGRTYMLLVAEALS